MNLIPALGPDVGFSQWLCKNQVSVGFYAILWRFHNAFISHLKLPLAQVSFLSVHTCQQPEFEYATDRVFTLAVSRSRTGTRIDIMQKLFLLAASISLLAIQISLKHTTWKIQNLKNGCIFDAVRKVLIKLIQPVPKTICHEKPSN